MSGTILRRILIVGRPMRQIRFFENMTNVLHQKSRKQKIVDTLFWIIPATCCGLGYWQWERHKWKTALIKTIDTSMRQEPIDLPQDLRLIKDMEYTRVRVKGTFDHSNEQIVGPRVLLKKEGFKLISSSDNGYWVFTPFKLSDRPYSVLVNRGWVPKHQKESETRKLTQVEGEVEITGVLRQSEYKKKFKYPIFDRTHGYWFKRDIEEIAKVCGCAPIEIDADASTTIPGGPVGGQTRVSLPNDHFHYMMTWLALALVSSVICFTRSFPRLAKKLDDKLR